MSQWACHHRVGILGAFFAIAVRPGENPVERQFDQRVEKSGQLERWRPLSVPGCHDHPTLRWTTSTEVNNFGFTGERRAASADSGTSWFWVGFVSDSGISSSPREDIFVDTNVLARRYAYSMKYESREKPLEVLGLERINEVLGTRAGEKSEFQVSKADIFALIGRSLHNVPEKEKSLTQASRVREKYKHQQNKYVFGGRRAGTSRLITRAPRHTS